jgi:hypothetical protein
VVLTRRVVFVLAENLRPNLSKLIFADRFLVPEMEDNFNELVKEDVTNNLGQQTSSEKTKMFLKKLEIQHKLLARMINPEPPDSASDAENNS